MDTVSAFIVCWTIAIFAGLATWIWAMRRDAKMRGRRR